MDSTSVTSTFISLMSLPLITSPAHPGASQHLLSLGFFYTEVLQMLPASACAPFHTAARATGLKRKLHVLRTASRFLFPFRIKAEVLSGTCRPSLGYLPRFLGLHLRLSLASRWPLCLSFLAHTRNGPCPRAFSLAFPLPGFSFPRPLASFLHPKGLH